MSAHTVPTSCLSFCNLPGGKKEAIMILTPSASYDAGGSTADFSTSGNLGPALGFQTVFAVELVAAPTAANSLYKPVCVPTASTYAAATCKIKIHDHAQAASAEVSGDVSTKLMHIRVTGT
jgi:hypothetical protein